MSDTEQIRTLLQRWALNTQQGRLDDVLQDHAANVVIYDVLPPMKYEGAAEYRASWGDWQPELQSEGEFRLLDLQITAGSDVAFAYGLIQCGGTYPDGRKLSDLVRATFCLHKDDGSWQVHHQHISKPFSMPQA